MDNFEDLMKKNSLGDVLKKSENLDSKEKIVYKAVHYPPGEEVGTVIEEFDSKEEYEAWYDSGGMAVEHENGGRIKMETGPSEIKREDAELSVVNSDVGDKASADTEKFEKLIRSLKRPKLERNIIKEDHVFNILYKGSGERAYRLFTDADTIDEARDIVLSIKNIAKEEGYDMDIVLVPKKNKK